MGVRQSEATDRGGHGLTNSQVAARLRYIGDALAIKGENRFKVLAYYRAADNIENLGRSLVEVWQAGELQTIPGVGQALAKKLDELFRTGRLGYQERLEAEVPPGVVELLKIPDVGPSTARLLWQHLGVTSIADAERAARAGRLRELPGLGAKSEAKILAGIELLARRSTRALLGTVWPVADELLATLQATCPAVLRAAPAGSVRRRRATIGDLDLLVASADPEAVMDAFVALPVVAEVLLRGPTKSSVRLHDGLQADLRVLAPERWGTGLQYFTGSKAHNVRLRELALTQGWSLSEYALTRQADGKEVLCAEEEEVYNILGLPWIPPELREDRGEIAAAQVGQLPCLIELTDIRGDLHAHSNWSDGQTSLSEMADAARALGYEYLVISDHSQGLGVANGLSPERLWTQREEIQRLNRQWSDFQLLQGVELEIKADGSLDFEDEVLAQLDVVIASVHSSLRQERQILTQRLLRAIENPYVTVIGHPEGRLLGQREASDINVDVVLQAAASTGTIMEINSIPNRLDLDDVYVKRAIELGVGLVINSDAHSAEGLKAMVYGVATARRGWAEATHILNTLPRAELLARLQSKRRR